MNKHVDFVKVFLKIIHSYCLKGCKGEDYPEMLSRSYCCNCVIGGWE